MSEPPSRPLRQGERNPGASILARLKNHARSNHEDMPFVLARYTIERFLYRLSLSPHAHRFVLRGATLFSLWRVEDAEPIYRPTRDLDLLAVGDSSIEAFRQLLVEILSVAVPEDGIVFLTETLVVEERTVGRAYPGLYVSAVAQLDSARPRLEMDISFGEAITPSPEDVDLPTLLGLPLPRLRAYPRETVVAEKVHALVSLGLDNTRLKDFFDLWYLLSTFPLDAGTLRAAVEATFTRRGTAYPQDEIPVALTDAFALDPGKQRLWSAYRSRLGKTAAPADLPQLIADLRGFVLPILHSEPLSSGASS